MVPGFTEGFNDQKINWDMKLNLVVHHTDNERLPMVTKKDLSNISRGQHRGCIQKGNVFQCPQKNYGDSQLW